MNCSAFAPRKPIDNRSPLREQGDDVQYVRQVGVGGVAKLDATTPHLSSFSRS